MKKPTRKKLIKDCDDLCREIIRKRDKMICQKCGKPVTTRNAHASHVYTKKKYPHLRHNLQNLKLLCFYCHRFWWHQEPMEAMEWFKEKFPYRYEYLLCEKERKIKYSTLELEDVREYLKERVKE